MTIGLTPSAASAATVVGVAAASVGTAEVPRIQLAVKEFVVAGQVVDDDDTAAGE